jgi:hypothetical protein
VNFKLKHSLRTVQVRCDWSKRLMPNRQNPRPLAIASPDTEPTHLPQRYRSSSFCANSHTARTSRGKRCRTIPSNSLRCPLDEPAVQLQGARNKHSVSPSSSCSAPRSIISSSIVRRLHPANKTISPSYNQLSPFVLLQPSVCGRTPLEHHQFHKHHHNCSRRKSKEQSADRVVATDCAQPVVHLAPCDCA